jgi:transposase
MLNIEKQSVGIDIAKDSFTACICSKGANLEIHFSKVLLFENNKKGFNKFIKWFRKNSNKSTPSIFLMEATGVY